MNEFSIKENNSYTLIAMFSQGISKRNIVDLLKNIDSSSMKCLKQIMRNDQ